MNKISIYSVPVLFVISLILFSCSKDPITPDDEGGFDSARYDWTVDTFYQDIKDIGAVDTNEIYLLTDNSLLVFDGQNYISHQIGDPSFATTFLGVVKSDLVYIGGGNSFPNPQRQRLFKWNGSSISEININITPRDSQAIGPLYPFSENEVWMCGVNDGIIRYNGSNFEYFELDSGYHIFPVFKVNNEVYCAGYNSYQDSSATYFEDYMNIYKFEGSNWITVFKDTIKSTVNHYYPLPYSSLINNNMVARTYSTLYEFNGSNFFPVLESNNINFGVELAGTSFSDIMALGFEFSSSEQALFHWNGNKWSKEIMSIDLKIFPSVKHKLISIADQYMLLGKGYFNPFFLYRLKPK